MRDVNAVTTCPLLVPCCCITELIDNRLIYNAACTVVRRAELYGLELQGEAAGATFTRIKEKNRLAQQRFRAKQKNMVATLKTRLAELEELVRACCSV